MLAIQQVTTNQSDHFYSSLPILLQEIGLMNDSNLIHPETTRPIHQARHYLHTVSFETTQLPYGDFVNLSEPLFVLCLL